VRLLVLGSPVGFTAGVLARLLEAGVELAAVGLYRGDAHVPEIEDAAPALAVAATDPVSALCAARGVPVDPIVDARAPSVLARARERAPDVLLTACFPAILRRNWLSLPERAALNLHPSLLPAYRGPTPVFWQLHAGEVEGGVTVHELTPSVDGGPVAGQRRVPFPAGLSASELNARLADTGGQVVAEVMARIEAGNLTLWPQREATASYLPAPGPADFALDTGWTAERAFRFVRGTREWGVPYDLAAGGRLLRIERALDFDAEARPAQPLVVDRRELRIRFSPGVLRVVGDVVGDERT
jgi:methionyl-tRNA formyltransferase